MGLAQALGWDLQRLRPSNRDFPDLKAGGQAILHQGWDRSLGDHPRDELPYNTTQALIGITNIPPIPAEVRMARLWSSRSPEGRVARRRIRYSARAMMSGTERTLTSQATQQGELAALIAAVADRRDREAFTRLFDHFAPRLNAYLRRLGTDPATAEEIAQETMVTLWHKAPQFDPQKSSLTTWLYRIARNRRVDNLRRNRLDFLDASDPILEAADETDLLAEVDMQQRKDAVRSALASLPEEQLSVVRLAFFDDLSHSQISEQIGLPLGTVKSRIRLGFTRLRRSLEAGGVAEAG
jgi:RNA polymerase sigma factor (sigma-70 family)